MNLEACVIPCILAVPKQYWTSLGQMWNVSIPTHFETDLTQANAAARRSICKIPQGDTNVWKGDLTTKNQRSSWNALEADGPEYQTTPRSTYIELSLSGFCLELKL